MNITVTYDLFRLQALFLTELFYKAVAHDLLRRQLLRRQVLSFTELFYKAVAHDLLRRQVLSFTELFNFIMNVTVAHGCE